MDRTSRQELLKTIETQQEQLQRYEKRLRDVVQAYKGLVKEKEALEASLTALSAGTTSKRKAEAEAATSETEAPNDPLGVQKTAENREGEGDGQDELSTLKAQVATLSASMSTLTSEKSRLEGSFLADKKQLRQENEDLKAKLEKAEEKAEKKEKDLQAQLQDLRNRIRSQQVEREKEQTDHAAMLRELQKLYAVERMAKEHFEHQLEEAQKSLQERSTTPEVAEQYQQRIRELGDQLKAVREQLRASEQRSSEPPPLLLELQKEMAEMRENHTREMVRERNRVEEADERTQQSAQAAEDRVSGLEARLSELSESVGNYERLRFQDQQAIQRLKERVSQLDMENTALARAANCPNMEEEEKEEEESNLDATALAQKLVRLNAQLKKANLRSEKPVDVIVGTPGWLLICLDMALLKEDEDKDIDESPLCQKYKEEMEKVKEEFERYKLRAQSVLKNKKQDTGTTKEVEGLHKQVSEMRERLKMALHQNEDTVEQAQIKQENLSKVLLAAEERHRREMEQTQAENQKAVSEIELQLKKHRERTVAMLAEKDQEIEALKAGGHHRLEHDYLANARETVQTRIVRANSEDRSLSGGQGRPSSQEEALSKLLDLPSTHLSETTLLHYAQEQARRDVEMNSMRKQKRQLEMALRELQQSASSKEERLHEEVEGLREEVRKMERDKNREGANLEYLKNVVFKFLTCSDHGGKLQMLNAITTILQFSPQERDRSYHYMKGWWAASQKMVLDAINEWLKRGVVVIKGEAV